MITGLSTRSPKDGQQPRRADQVNPHAEADRI